LSDFQSTTPPAFSINLGAIGLPEHTQMLPGGVYALTAMIPSARFALLAGALGSAYEQGLVSTIVVHSRAEQFLSRIAGFGNFDAPALHHEHRLHVFVMHDEFQKKLFRFGVERLLRELENYGVPENSFLVFDSAQTLLSLHDVAMAQGQVDILARWFKKRRITALLVFTAMGEAQLEAVDALMDSLTGVAKLDTGPNHLQLTFRYWRWHGSISEASRQYLLWPTESGMCEAVPFEPAFVSSTFERSGFDSSAFGKTDFGPTDSGFADSGFLQAQGMTGPAPPGRSERGSMSTGSRRTAERTATTFSYRPAPADRAARAKAVPRAKRTTPMPDS
jgi:hypothetical protein